MCGRASTSTRGGFVGCFGGASPRGRRLHQTLIRRLGYWTRQHGVALAGYWAREIEQDNRVHLHLLIRTDLEDRAGISEKVEQASGGLAAVEDMLREAHESAENSRWSAISFLAGFALFLVVPGEFGSAKTTRVGRQARSSAVVPVSFR